MTMFKKTKKEVDLLEDPSAQYFMNKVDYLMTFSVAHHYRFVIFANFILKHNLTSILDVGFGYAALVKYLQDFQFKGNYLGIDLNEEYCKLANNKKKTEEFNIEYRFQKLEEVEEKFDCIVLGELIEHVEPQEKVYDFLKLCESKLNENGYILIATPNKINGQLVNPDNHFDELSYNSLTDFCEIAGFKIIHRMGFWSNSKDTLNFLTNREKKLYEKWSSVLPNSLLNVYFNLLHPKKSRDMIFIIQKKK